MSNEHNYQIPEHVEKKITVIEPDFRTFLKLSAVLTDFSPEELMGTGMAGTYYFTIMKEFDQDQVRDFFKVAEDILEDPAAVNQRIQKELVPIPNDPNHPPPLEELPFQGLAQRIILMWYSGVWTSINGKTGEDPVITTGIISATAYMNGLIWTVAETHPAGARQPGYNSWHNAPIET